MLAPIERQQSNKANTSLICQDLVWIPTFLNSFAPLVCCQVCPSLLGLSSSQSLHKGTHSTLCLACHVSGVEKNISPHTHSSSIKPVECPSDPRPSDLPTYPTGLPSPSLFASLESKASTPKIMPLEKNMDTVNKTFFFHVFFFRRKKIPSLCRDVQTIRDSSYLHNDFASRAQRIPMLECFAFGAFPKNPQSLL